MGSKGTWKEDRMVCKCLFGNSAFDPAMKHETTDGQIDEGLGDLRLAFVVPAQTSGTAQPAERAFDDPAPGQHGEAARGVGAPDNLPRTPADPAHPLDELARVATVGPQTTQSAIHFESFGQEPTRARARRKCLSLTFDTFQQRTAVKAAPG